jgi:hypothetical protein
MKLTLRLQSHRMPKFLGWVVLALLSSLPVQANPIQEIWFATRPLDSLQLKKWEQHPNRPKVRVSLEDPTGSDLRDLKSIHKAGRLELVLGRYPDESTLPALKEFSAINPLWVAFNEGGFPVRPEIDRLNQLRLEKLIIAFTGIPSPGPARDLALLKAPLQLTYITREYPKFMDRDAWESLPKTAPLLISTDYWPQYNAMDILNVLRIPVSIRVRESFPPEESWPYLLNIKTLQKVEIESEWDGPQDQTWERFGKLPVRWIRKSAPPSKEGRQRFEASRTIGTRDLLLDFDLPLSSQERAELENSPLDISWLRSSDSVNSPTHQVAHEIE